jgi:hypothetical protein
MRSENGKTTTLNIPATVRDVQRRGGLIAEVIDTRDWERAAIVRAWCKPGKPGPKDRSAPNRIMSFGDFARLKIPGLTSRQTVAQYYKAWDLTDLPEPEPGESVTIPSGTIEFPRSEPPDERPDTSGINVTELEAASGELDDDPDYDPEPSGDKPSDKRPAPREHSATTNVGRGKHPHKPAEPKAFQGWYRKTYGGDADLANRSEVYTSQDLYEAFRAGCEVS